MAKTKATPAVYQLTITLADIQPPIWRRLEVADCTLARLHEIIQKAMGWEFEHLWAFEIKGEQYGESRGRLADLQDARSVKLSRIVDAGTRTFRYIYDFGDNWEHVIKIEKTLQPEPKVKYPRCVDGSRACPPEDCGGPWGYGDFVEAITNPEHPEHDERREWIGDDFDPEEFHLNRINKHLGAG